ncbi:MAG: hypothetical protein MZU79_01035 [Anaerotruncus sp.]|nr:hypothetical protein [Anaerotruncus sp.]
MGSPAPAGARPSRENTIVDLRSASRATSTATSASVLGIILNTSAAADQQVSRNRVYALSSSSTNTGTHVVGIYYSGATSGTSLVTRNFVHSLWSEDVNSGAGMTGMRLDGGTVSVNNNLIRLGIDSAGTSITKAQVMYGIYKTSVGNAAIHFNSIYVGGSGIVTTATPTYGLIRTFDRYGRHSEQHHRERPCECDDGGKHYALWFNNSVSTSGVTCDNNVLKAGGTGGVLCLREAPITQRSRHGNRRLDGISAAASEIRAS